MRNLVPGKTTAKFLTILMSLLVCSTALAASVKALIDQAAQHELDGKFKESAALLKKAAVSPDSSQAEQRLIGFELDRLERIRRDFPLTRDALFRELRESVEDLTRKEFDSWIEEGRFDSRVIDGKRFYMSASVSNLYFRYPEIEGRRKQAKPLRRAKVADIASAIRTAAIQTGSPYVLPMKFRATMNVSLKPGAAKPGQQVRAWLPVPRAYPFQTGFEVLSSSPSVKIIAPETSPIRSAYFETTADKDGAAKFSITYRVIKHGVSFQLDPEKARKPELTPELGPFTREAPHIVFTPEMKALAAKIAGNEPNILRRAKRYYDWIGENIKYSYAIEYSTIRNISDYCRTKGYGDCGQEALLFMTLCRMDGIPARWQSGWNIFPGGKTIHDWCEIYIEPWGWFPVDPYMSIYATRYATNLEPEQKRQVRDFYFGGLDQYRIAANCDHSQELTPPKTGYRSDTVDFQRGEIDVDGRNVYYDKFTYSLDYTEDQP